MLAPGAVHSTWTILNSRLHLPFASFTLACNAAPVVSAPAVFVTGLLHQSDWEDAAWIGGGNLLRKEFDVNAAPARVSVFVGACQV